VIEQQEAHTAVPRLRAVEPPLEESIDVRRYVNALRRSRWLIAAIVVGLTAMVLALSLVSAKTYTSQATILFDENPGIAGSTDAERQLATIQKLTMTRDVLALSAHKLQGESISTLAGKVHASVDPNANIVNVTASDSSPAGAARIANSVARAFLARERAVELARLQASKTRLTAAIKDLRGTPNGKAEIPLIRARLSELSLSEATAGSELELADPARPPASASSPRPVRNAGFALIAALFLGVLVALGRERVAPRVADARELERLGGFPVVAEVPSSGGPQSAQAAAAERDAYGVLAAIVAAQLPQQGQQIVLVTSALADKEKARVAAKLSRALAQNGETALVVDADLRRPSLERMFGMERAPGLAEILAAARHGDTDTAAGMIVEPPTSATSRGRTGSLAVLGAGEAASPALVSPDALEALFDELRRSAFTFVVIHAPPLLEPEGSRSWARHVDGALVVSRLGRMSPSDVVELRDQLETLDTTVLGHVMLDGKKA
jgi:tyrosine-protein kinase